MISESQLNFIVLIPEIYLLFVALVVFLVGLFSSAKDINQQIMVFKKNYYIIVISIFFTFVLLFSIGDLRLITLNGLYILSPNIFLFKTVILSLAIFILPMLFRYLINESLISYEYIFLTILTIVSCMLLVSSNDFISFYVTFELLTVCTYVLILMKKDSIISLESGIKYFILGALGTGFLLYGISLLYGFTGSTNFIEIKEYIFAYNNNLILILSIILIIVGIGFKLSLVPFHMWTKDVYYGSNLFILTLMSTVIKISIFFVFLRVLWEPLIFTMHYWESIIVVITLITVLVGFIGAINNTNINSLIAYSSIANMGFVLMTTLSVTEESIVAAIMYMFVYSLSLVGFIGVISFLRYGNKAVTNIYDLKGLFITHPSIAVFLATLLVSMAGIPVTSGFFIKLFIIIEMFNNAIYIVPSIVMVLSVSIMYIYLKIIKIMFFNDYSNSTVCRSTVIPVYIYVICLVIFAITVGYVFFIKYLHSFLYTIANII